MDSTLVLPLVRQKEKNINKPKSSGIKAAMTAWDAFIHDLWPYGPQIIRSGERPSVDVAQRAPPYVS